MIFVVGGYVDQSGMYGAQAAPAASAGKNQDDNYNARAFYYNMKISINPKS